MENSERTAIFEPASVVDFLKQGMYVDQRIDALMAETGVLRQQVENPEATERMRAMLRTVEEELERTTRLRDEIRYVICQIKNPDRAMVLKYRFMFGMITKEIEAEMHLSNATVRRWGYAALRELEQMYRAERRLRTGEIRIRRREREQK